MFVPLFYNSILANNLPISAYDSKAADFKEEIVKNKGFITNFNGPVYGPQMGDLSMLTFNLYTENVVVSNLNALTSEVSSTIDQAKPTFVAIQAMEKSQMLNLKNILSPSYDMIGEEYVNTDLRRGREEYRPMFYAKSMYELLKSGEFAPASHPNHSYATFGVFRNKKQSDKIFTVVNVDLYSADSTYIQEQLYNIVKHVESSPYSAYPVFVAGMINEQTTNVKKLIQSTFKNGLTQDVNNKYLQRTTYHHTDMLNDNVQRDFILLKDEHKMFRVNYARILSLFEKKRMLHFPVHHIYSYNASDASTQKK